MTFPICFTPGRETRHPLCRRLDGPQGQIEQVLKISISPRFNPQTVQPVVSRCTDQATPFHNTHINTLRVVCHINLNQLKTIMYQHNKLPWKVILHYNETCENTHMCMKQDCRCTNPTICTAHITFVLAELLTDTKGVFMNSCSCALTKSFSVFNNNKNKKKAVGTVWAKQEQNQR